MATSLETSSWPLCDDDEVFVDDDEVFVDDDDGWVFFAVVAFEWCFVAFALPGFLGGANDVLLSCLMAAQYVHSLHLQKTQCL